MCLNSIFNPIALFLDDVRKEPKGWVRVKTADRCIKVLEGNRVKVLSLDHDLGENENGTGYDVVLWMEKRIRGDRDWVLPKHIIVHSVNAPARERMFRGLIEILKISNSFSLHNFPYEENIYLSEVFIFVENNIM